MFLLYMLCSFLVCSTFSVSGGSECNFWLQDLWSPCPLCLQQTILRSRPFGSPSFLQAFWRSRPWHGLGRCHCSMPWTAGCPTAFSSSWPALPCTWNRFPKEWPVTSPMVSAWSSWWSYLARLESWSSCPWRPWCIGQRWVAPRSMLSSTSPGARHEPLWFVRVFGNLCMGKYGECLVWDN